MNYQFALGALTASDTGQLITVGDVVLVTEGRRDRTGRIVAIDDIDDRVTIELRTFVRGGRPETITIGVADPYWRLRFWSAATQPDTRWPA